MSQESNVFFGQQSDILAPYEYRNSLALKWCLTVHYLNNHLNKRHLIVPYLNDG